MYLNPNETNLFECSIFHYFNWKYDEAIRDNHLRTNHYKRIIQVMKEELSHVTETTPTTLSSSSTPEVCFRWMKYATMRNILVNTEIPGNNTTKRKRDMADETTNLSKALIKSIPEEEITLENAKLVLFTLRKEHSEVKKITESLESKLAKSEKIYSELLKFSNKKLRLEKRLASLQSVEEEAKKTDAEQIVIDDNPNITNLESTEKETTTEQNKLDDQHDANKVTEVGEGGYQDSNVRATLETKKRKLELQETLYANAILYEVHYEKGQQYEEASNGRKLTDFNSRLKELFEFKQEFGHCQVGMKTHSSLYHWLCSMRQCYRLKHPRLSPEGIAKMDALGVVWDVADGNKKKAFESYVKQCQDFKEKHGHLRIPLITERNEDGTELTEDDIRLRIWAQSIRIQYKKRKEPGISGKYKAKLDKYRIAILDNIGFEWNIPDTTSNMEIGINSDVDNNQTPGDIMFRIRIEQLRKVKEIYGNCNEKKNILSVYPNNNAIIKWMKKQRVDMKYEKTTLTKEKQEMLHSIEFDFDPRRHYTPPISNKKTWPTKMELLAIELQDKKTKNNNNNQDLENNNSEYNDDSDME